MPTLGEAWRQVRDRFRAAGIPTPELDAQLLARIVFRMDAAGLFARESDLAARGEIESLSILAGRRLSGEPVARIVGHKEFYGLDFSLNAATLIPRPETELVVDLAIKALGGPGPHRLLDLGTGSGAIAIAVVANLQEVRAVATDVSEEALGAARNNADDNGVGGRVEFRLGDWYRALAAAERFEAIVSNPPYIESGAIAGLMPEVRDFDPALALDGGNDGLDAYRSIVGEARWHLNADAPLIVEIGSTQAAAVVALLAAAGFSNIRVEKDLAGLDRVVIGYHLTTGRR
jgi:release factor glutamine methyltransferase